MNEQRTDRLAAAIASRIMGDAEMIERVGIRSWALPLLGDMPERLNIREIEAIIRREIAAEEGDE